MRIISDGEIARAIYLVSKNRSNPELRDLSAKVVDFLARKRLLSRSKSILENLDRVIDRASNRVLVKISSARRLENAMKEQLVDFLKIRYQAKDVVFAENINEKLLGGIKVEANDEIIDLTLINKLNKLKEHLIR